MNENFFCFKKFLLMFLYALNNYSCFLILIMNVIVFLYSSHFSNPIKIINFIFVRMYVFVFVYTHNLKWEFGPFLLQLQCQSLFVVKSLFSAIRCHGLEFYRILEFFLWSLKVAFQVQNVVLKFINVIFIFIFSEFFKLLVHFRIEIWR